MKRFAFIASLIFFIPVSIFAQDQVEALRYSMFSPIGTARYQGMGGALGAVGGDFTSVSFNPAGLAVYRSPEFEFTPSFQLVKSGSSFLGNSYTSSNYNFSFSSLGYVSVKKTGRTNGLVSVNYGFGYNTLANFNSLVTMKGINNNSSLLDDFTLYANNSSSLDPFYDQLAYDTNLMPWDETAGEYWNDLENGGYGQQQLRQVETSGYIGEYSFSTAFNFSDFLYLGATVGLQNVRFYEDIYHNEQDLDNHIEYLQGFTFTEYNTTQGSGINFKIGAIVRPVQMLRLGASIHFPTFYTLTETKESDISSYWDANSGIDNETAYSPYGTQHYKLRTPMRITASAAFILGKFGLVSADYEFVDYSSAFLNSSTDKYFDANDAVANDYRAVHNLKLGAEVRLQPLYLRAGIQAYMSPFTDTENDGSVLAPSLGIGYRNSSFFMDMSYQYKSRNEVYGLYSTTSGLPETALNTYRTNNVLLTVGFKF